MFEEMRLAALIQKPLHGPRAMNAQTVFEMATSNGAAALGLESDIGSIEPGKKGDLVLLDINQPWNPYEITDVYSSIVYSGSAENVHSVLVDGKWVYKNKQYTTLDGARVMSNANNELRLLLQRVH
jgi:5-methylthioadenosine/S-adenosylhomocysteine deaminase